MTMILLDLSASVQQDEWRKYAEAIEQIASRATPRDRIVLATISDQPGSRFQIVSQHEFRSTGNSVHDKVHGQRARAGMRAEFERLRDQSRATSQSTLILDAVTSSAEWFDKARADGLAPRLVLLSDMVEESPGINFAHQTPTADATRQIIDRQQRAGLMPKLPGVKVQVVGASGRDLAHMMAIRRFWEAYFSAAGAQLLSYGRNALTV